MDFKEELKKYQQKINQELEKYIKKQDCPEALLNQSMEYSLMAGGKRLRYGYLHRMDTLQSIF